MPPLEAVEVQAQGQVGSNPTAPVVFAGGVVSAASFSPGATLAPGAIVSVFGRNLARGINQSSRVPLETTLGGASLRIGNANVPLFYAGDGQINAQIPFDLATNTRQQLVARTQLADGTQVVTVPETITIGTSQAAIFTMSQDGRGQGAILGADGRLVDRAAPARAGDFVQVYCTGLGATNPAVASGQAAPDAEPLARVVTAVEARVGGRSAAVQFAGLAPRFVGLYQVNVQIPEGVAPGDAVSLVLTQNGVPSNTVTLAVR